MTQETDKIEADINRSRHALNDTIEQLGGKPAPGVGFAIGLERLLLLLAEAGVAPPPEAPIAYAVLPEADLLAPAMVAIEALREAGVSVLMHAGGHSMKAQFKRADASGARFALVFGRDHELLMPTLFFLYQEKTFGPDPGGFFTAEQAIDSRRPAG